MLAEVTIVSAVVVVALVTLFTAINRLASAYTIRNRYYDIDSLYIAMEVNDILLDNAIINGINKDNLATNEISSFIDNLRLLLNKSEMVKDEVTKVKNLYNDSEVNIYITKYTTLNNDNSTEANSLKNLNSHKTFNEFLEYLSRHLDFDADYDYLIIVERQNKNNENDCYYYALKLKYYDKV